LRNKNLTEKLLTRRKRTGIKQIVKIMEDIPHENQKTDPS
jgi:hypothetical protein